MYIRFKTYNVKIGNIPLGEVNPVRIQSMTNTNTLDTESTVNQVIKIVKAGADYVRITVPSVKSAKNLEVIKTSLLEKGYNTPLIADIHFSPKIAEVSACIVDKIRINPGNYTDVRNIKNKNYSDAEYKKSVKKIKEKFLPLVMLCKEKNTAMRIGANHGSLSDRILNRYGDTPFGMVESVMEFLRICFEQDFFDVVISMKASNPVVMIYASRLLVKIMKTENMRYPIHLGVTEAGSDDEGRIKSSVGIGTLLADGIGDTIRVSLTEEPEREIPIAKAITNIFKPEKLGNFKPPFVPDFEFEDKYEYKKRKTINVYNIGANNVPVVISDLSNYDKIIDKYLKTKTDYFYIGKKEIANEIGEGKKIIINSKNWKKQKNTFPLFSVNEFLNTEKKSDKINFIFFSINDLNNNKIKKISTNKTVVLVAHLNDINSRVHEARFIFRYLSANKIETPVVLKYDYSTYNEKMLISSSAESGALFIDGYGDGLWLNTNDYNAEKVNDISFGILQACRLRITKTEYISCPSCGRTLFDLQKTTSLIKEKTAHLPPVKIGIMGCIVNGPGEMADADYGYVGTSRGRINLYKNKDIVKKNILEKDAVTELLKLIKRGT